MMKKDLLDRREMLSLERDRQCHGMVDASPHLDIYVFFRPVGQCVSNA